MDQPKEKLRLIFYPYLAVAGSFIIVYSFLNWFLTVHTSMLTVSEEATDFFAPIVLSIIPVVVWVVPRIKLLNLKTKKRESNVFGVAILVVIAIGAPTMVAQNYMRSATGKLTALNDITEIESRPAAKFYTIKKHFIDKENRRLKYTVQVTGKYNGRLDLHIYLAVPITDTLVSPLIITDTVFNPSKIIQAPAEDTVHANTANINNLLIILDEMIVEKPVLDNLSPDSVFNVTILKAAAAKALYGDAGKDGAMIITTKKFAHSVDNIITPRAGSSTKAWLCISYYKQISNHLSNEEEMDKRKIFYKESLEDFNTKNLNDFVYLERIGNTNDRDKYKAAIAKSAVIKLAEPILLKPKFNSFDERNGHQFAWIFGALAIGSLVFLLIVLFAKFNEAKLANYLNGTIVREESATKEYLQLFIPKKGFYVTPIIMYINIAVFILMVVAGLGFVNFDASDLLKWGANYGPSTVNNQWWRLLTSIFLHGGIMHLLSNMYGLLFVGIFLEPVLSKRSYALVYVATGILASFTSLWWHTATVSVGASGAIFGLYGTFLALLLMKVFPKAVSKTFLITTTIFIIYNLVMGLTGGIDNAAHIGGLVSGFVIGLLIAPSIKEKNSADLTDS
jgi:membrane associated rhomboid family serine protease